MSVFSHPGSSATAVHVGKTKHQTPAGLPAGGQEVHLQGGHEGFPGGPRQLVRHQPLRRPVQRVAGKPVPDCAQNCGIDPLPLCGSTPSPPFSPPHTNTTGVNLHFISEIPFFVERFLVGSQNLHRDALCFFFWRSKGMRNSKRLFFELGNTCNGFVQMWRVPGNLSDMWCERRRNGELKNGKASPFLELLDGGRNRAYKLGLDNSERFPPPNIDKYSKPPRMFLGRIPQCCILIILIIF